MCRVWMMAGRFRSLESSAAMLSVEGNIAAGGIRCTCRVRTLVLCLSFLKARLRPPAPSLRLSLNLNMEPIPAGVHGSLVAHPIFMKHVDHFFPQTPGLSSQLCFIDFSRALRPIVRPHRHEPGHDSTNSTSTYAPAPTAPIPGGKKAPLPMK